METKISDLLEDGTNSLFIERSNVKSLINETYLTFSQVQSDYMTFLKYIGKTPLTHPVAEIYFPYLDFTSEEVASTSNETSSL